MPDELPDRVTSPLSGSASGKVPVSVVGGLRAGGAVLVSGSSPGVRQGVAATVAVQLGGSLHEVLAEPFAKYIGETEKNLDRLLRAAAEREWILLFDEADALFGRRTRVMDSHDRYANIEVSYLLARLELYRGVAIFGVLGGEGDPDCRRFDPRELKR